MRSPGDERRSPLNRTSNIVILFYLTLCISAAFLLAINGFNAPTEDYKLGPTLTLFLGMFIVGVIPAPLITVGFSLGLVLLSEKVNLFSIRVSRWMAIIAAESYLVLYSGYEILMPPDIKPNPHPILLFAVLAFFGFLIGGLSILATEMVMNPSCQEPNDGTES